MTNKFKPHLYILLEDDANRQITNGFLKNPNINDFQVQVLPIAKGGGKVVEQFENNHIREMRRFSHRIMILLLDIDNNDKKVDDVKNKIPPDLESRVFVLGVWSEPENLNTDLRHKGYEYIGTTLAKDCDNNTDELWGHELLKHNKPELERMGSVIKAILFN